MRVLTHVPPAIAETLINNNTLNATIALVATR